MQAIVAYIVVGSWHLWIIIPIIFITHLSIGFWKTTQKEKLSSFTIDQILHLSVIALLWLCLTNQFRSFTEACCNIMKHNQIWAVLICYLIILKPTSLFLGLFTKRWRTDSAISESLKNAGQWIGYLERFLILTFILINEMSTIGFLLAAKSIFRFGELNKSKEIKTTEYVLIGTLASFSIAIFI